MDASQVFLTLQKGNDLITALNPPALPLHLFQAKVSTGIDPELQFLYFEGIYLLVLNG